MTWNGIPAPRKAGTLPWLTWEQTGRYISGRLPETIKAGRHVRRQSGLTTVSEMLTFCATPDRLHEPHTPHQQLPAPIPQPILPPVLQKPAALNQTWIIPWIRRDGQIHKLRGLHRALVVRNQSAPNLVDRRRYRNGQQGCPAAIPCRQLMVVTIRQWGLIKP